MSIPVETMPVNNKVNFPVNTEKQQDSSWVGRAVNWLHTTPGGHLMQGIGGLLGSAASAMAAVAVTVAALKGIILGVALLTTIVLIPLGIVVIAASCSLATNYNYPLQAIGKCWDFAMDQFAQMKAKSLANN